VSAESWATRAPAPAEAAAAPALERADASRPPAAIASRRGSLVRRLLVAADLLGLALAFLVAELLFGETTPLDRFTMAEEYLLFLATLPGWLVFTKLYKLYDRDEERADHSTVEEIFAVFHLVTVGAWSVFVAAWASGAAEPGMTKLVAFWALAVTLIVLFRGAARAAARRSPAYVQNAVVIGAGDVGQLVARKLLQHREEFGINLLGLVDDAPRDRREDLDGVQLLGPLDDVPRLVEDLGVERVFVAFTGASHERTNRLVSELMARNVQVDIVPRLYEVVGPHVTIHSLEGVPLVALPRRKPFPFSSALKRFADVVAASGLLLVTAPVFALFALRIKRDSPGPVFFRQERLGLHQVPFQLIKFRTMRADTDDAAHREFVKNVMSASAAPTENGLYKLERTDAITPFGRFLRKTSLDELPQLINVLRGEMSLVGPRPCLAYETEHFAPHHFERFSVPQGITGLWQVTARAHATFGEALDMDVQYARSWSLGLDLWLLLRTPLHVLRRKGTA
jgi:exopolysaccharide biosynthesis polyprenyl glycosylphosphotransferase